MKAFKPILWILTLAFVGACASKETATPDQTSQDLESELNYVAPAPVATEKKVPPPASKRKAVKKKTPTRKR